MFGFQSKILTTDEELLSYSEAYLNAFQKQRLKPLHSLAIHNLRRYHRTVGIYHRGALVSGFIVNCFPNRCFEDVPLETQRAVIDELGRDEICEVVAIWKARDLRHPLFPLVLWPLIAVEGLRSRRKYVFGCAYKDHGKGRDYYRFQPRIVHHGRSANELNVFYYTRAQFLMTAIASVWSGLKAGLKAGARPLLPAAAPAKTEKA